MRLIDADEMITWFDDHYDDEIVTVGYVRGLIKDEPTIEVPQRKKGKWVQISPAKIYECSVCGQNVMTDDIDAYRWCHGCGADMRKE